MFFLCLIMAGVLMIHIPVLASDKKAVLICVDQFENKAFNEKKQLPALKNDVQLLARVLAKNAYDVVVLESGSSRKPTHKNILQTLEDHNKRTLSHQTLLVYFTGHGKGKYLCPYDFNPSYETSGLELSKLVILVKTAGVGKKFLFLDACHSGAAIDGDAAKDAKDYAIDQNVLAKEADQEGFYIIASCRQDEQSFVDTQESPQLSYFSKYLIKGLEGAADGYGEGCRPDCIVQLPELHHFLEEKVSAEVAKEMPSRLSPSRQVTQRPHILATLSLDVELTRLTGCAPQKDPALMVMELQKQMEAMQQEMERLKIKPVERHNAKKKDSPEPDPGKIWTESVTGMEFVRVPGGSFMMGQSEKEKNWLVENFGKEDYEKYCKDEMPRHQVGLDGFWMGQHEVTRGQFKRFVDETNHHSDVEKEGAYIINKSTQWKWEKRKGFDWKKPGYDQDDYHPVVCVSWKDAKAFIQWLNKKSSHTFALPTEAQFEYAARAGTQTMRFWGKDDTLACEYANVADKGNNWSSSFSCDDGYFFTAPVGNYRPNPFGLYDMMGNAWEWCEDVYVDNAYLNHAKRNPLVTSGGSDRVYRGGSWNFDPRFLRAANRDRFWPEFTFSDLGFRLIRTD